ncbi:unnamed protein product, partial [Candidula unifasciata]
MEARQLHWTDAHFCGLRSQSNVYGLSKILTEEGQIKLIVATINGELISVEYQKSADNKIIPITREDILLSTGNHQGPGGETEIVSVDVICQDIQHNTVLAISYLKLGTQFEEKSPSACMNFYFLPGRQSDAPYPNIMDAITHSQTQNLDFIPFKLMHHYIYKREGQKEVCFLLSGNDNKIHIYRQQSKDDPSFYHDMDAVDKYFPELINIDGCVTQMEFRQIDGAHRLTVFGVQSGLVTLSLVNVVTSEIEQTWTTELDSPITSLQLFTQYTNVDCPEFLHKQGNRPGDKGQHKLEPVNLLITSAIDPAVVFCDVINRGLSENYHLPHSNTQDVILCSCVMDIDFDGENELIIGTYGQILLAYKFISERPQSILMTSTPYQSPLPVPVTDNSVRSSREKLSYDQADYRRRHKSVAAALENNGLNDRHELHDQYRSDESFLLEGNLKDGQLPRLVRSQENLAIYSPRSVNFNTPDYETTSDLGPLSGTLTDPMDYPCY